MDRWKEQLANGRTIEELFTAVHQLSQQIHNGGDDVGAVKLAQRWLACLATRRNEDLKAHFNKQCPMLATLCAGGFNIAGLSPQAAYEALKTNVAKYVQQFQAGTVVIYRKSADDSPYGLVCKQDVLILAHADNGSFDVTRPDSDWQDVVNISFLELKT